MPLRVVFERARGLAQGIWCSENTPEELGVLGRCLTSLGGRSVVAVSQPTFRAEEGRLEVEVSGCHVLNLGSQSGTYFIDLAVGTPASSGSLTGTASGLGGVPSKPGDRAFLGALRGMAEGLRPIGEGLLAEVRKKYPEGELRHEGRRFVERPDNFWTITPQSRDGSFAITVRGEPERFRVRELELKQDRPGHSRFKVAKTSQLSEALQVILSARRR